MKLLGGPYLNGPVWSSILNYNMIGQKSTFHTMWFVGATGLPRELQALLMANLPLVAPLVRGAGHKINLFVHWEKRLVKLKISATQKFKITVSKLDILMQNIHVCEIVFLNFKFSHTVKIQNTLSGGKTIACC